MYEYNNRNIVLEIQEESFIFALTHPETKEALIPGHSKSGLLVDGEVPKEILFEKNNSKSLKIVSSSGKKILIELELFDCGVKFQCKVVGGDFADIEFSTAGMGAAYGLGDNGGWLKDADVSKSGKVHYLKPDGGAKRWISSFLIFPEKRTAGVCFASKGGRVFVDRSEYRMGAKGISEATFYYFAASSIQDIYKVYREVREAEGFGGVMPKYRLFELGWESWDALKWQTSSESVKAYLQSLIEAGYPLRWACIGSGFWEDHGTTVSFGKWNNSKYPNPDKFKAWLNAKDIKLMIGQRVNFSKLGGPLKQSGKRDENADTWALNTAPDSSEGVDKKMFLNNSKTYISNIFPQVPCYLLDSRKEGAPEWFLEKFKKWGVDGAKEDTMIGTEEIDFYNNAVKKLAENGNFVISRCGAYSATGTLLRMNDTGGKIGDRTSINALQYAACGAPNVYSDTIGYGKMKSYNEKAVYEAWYHCLIGGVSLGRLPDKDKWSKTQLAFLKKALDFRYELTPYIFDAAVKSYVTGYPYTLTPLHIKYPDDVYVHEMANYAKSQYEWMIGESILAAPIMPDLCKSGKRDVYLPEGKWMDYESGKIFQGPLLLKAYELSVSQIPVFVGGKGVLLIRDRNSDKLFAKVYPVMSEKGNYEFVFPDTKGKCKIIYPQFCKNEKVKVTDTKTQTTVKYEVETSTGALVFPVMSGHEYVVSK